MSEGYIAVTQDIFQNLISRPKLLDKYLRRPPFRFIHDIVMNTMKVTGFPDGLFEENELNGKIIKDKHNKLSWLNKLIKCIESVHNESLNVNPNKLVAGLEPEYTNEMLQIFGKIAIQVANGQLSMQDILNNSENNQEEQQHVQEHQSQHVQEQEQKQEEEKSQPPQKSLSPIINIEDKDLEDGEENWMSQTQQTLGKLIERPRLLEKLLKRPPFRFLHDIIKSLIKSTGYPLQFLDENKDITNADIKDAKFKYYFLSKLIIIVSATINQDLSFIDPKNIIAGRQPQDTNYLLTKLGYAATLQINIDEIKQTIVTISQTKNANKKEKENIKTETKSSSETTTIGKNTARKSAPIMPKLELDQLKINNVENKKILKAPPCDLSQRISKRQIQQPQQQTPFHAIQKLQRPRTARRAPPKLKSNIVEQKENDIKTDILIMDDDNDNDNIQNIAFENEIEDIDNIDNNNMDNLNEFNAFIKNNDDLETVDPDDGTHGKLVRDILDAQSGIKLEATRLGTHRRGDSAKSVEKTENMREMIQKLCQTCVPLGKCIDFVFEDIESINNELLKWKQQIIKNKTILIQEKEKTNQILTPLQKELQNIKEQIKHQNQLILEKKAVLLRNEAKTNDIILKRLLNE